MRLAQVQDQELVRNYINGHEESLSELVTRHQKKVFTYIRMLVKDTELAEDLFQDVFVKVIHTLKSGNYNEEGKFLPWVMRIAHNISIDHFRKAKRIPVVQTKDDFDIFRTLQFSLSQAGPRRSGCLLLPRQLLQARGLVQAFPLLRGRRAHILLLQHY